MSHLIIKALEELLEELALKVGEETLEATIEYLEEQESRLQALSKQSSETFQKLLEQIFQHKKNNKETS